MSGYVLKAPDVALTYLMDWRRGYLAPGERVLRDLGWSVQPDAAEAARLAVTEQAHDASRSWAAFDGGVPGRVYLVTNRVRTSDDRTLSRAVVIRIASAAGGRSDRVGRSPAGINRAVARSDQNRAVARSEDLPMILTEVSAPPVEAVPVRAFAEHLRLGAGFADDGSLDAALELYLRAAMAAVEARIGRALLARPFAWTVTRWREEASQGLPIGPVRSVEGVVLVSAEGEATEVDPGAWSVLRDSQRPRLVGRFGRSLPKIPRSGHAEIRFTAGFGDTWDAVPADLRQAAFLLAAHFYENRAEAGGAAGAMPFGVLVLLEGYRATRIGGGVA